MLPIYFLKKRGEKMEMLGYVLGVAGDHMMKKYLL
jgi:hypothetical protein